jgi:hypothetical protein
VPRQLTAPARRVLERLAGMPACVCDATWTVLAGNRAWTKLECGGDGGQRGNNVAWRLFTGAPSAINRAPDHLDAFKASIVADLRAASRRYPADTGLRDLVAGLHASSEEFARLWRASSGPRHQADQITVHHPVAGSFRVDKDVMAFGPGDLHVVVFTAVAGSADARRLAQAIA